MVIYEHSLMGIPAWIMGMVVCTMFGSFAQASIWRLENGVSIFKGRSKCTVCATPLGPFELIPVLGWFLLMGRCQHCGSKISWTYPLGEFCLGAIGALVTLVYPGVPEGLPILWWGLMSLWVVGMVDCRTYYIYPSFLIFTWVVGVVLHLLLQPYLPLGPKVLGALVGGAGFWLLSWIGAAMAGEEAMGQGDVVFALWIGWFIGLDALGLWVGLSFVLAAAVGVPWYLVRIINKVPDAKRIPFGPFLALSAAIIWTLGQGRILMSFLDNVLSKW